MKNKTCCFTGHRHINKFDYEKIKVKLKQTIIELIENEIIYFGVGGALGFDILVEKCILELKYKYPHIKLILVLPCKEQSSRWGKADKLQYECIKSKADKIVYISEEYTEKCMLERNKHLIDNSSICVCYLNRFSGGTAYTVRYAKANGLKIINLGNLDIK